MPLCNLQDQRRSGEPVKVDGSTLLSMAKQKKPKYIKPMPIIKNASTTTVANSFSMLASLDEEEEMKESEEVVPPPPTPAPTSTPTKTRKTRRPKMAKTMCGSGFGRGGAQGCAGGCDCAGDDGEEVKREEKIREMRNGSGAGSVGFCGMLMSEDEVLNSTEYGWTKIEAVMDSGAADSVAPPDVAQWVPVTESPGSRRGQTYLSASGERLKNLGERRVEVVTNENRNMLAKFQVAEVTRPLFSVGKICDQGSQVIFKADGGYIIDQAGRTTSFRRENGIYVLDFYAQEGRSSRGFPRPS